MRILLLLILAVAYATVVYDDATYANINEIVTTHFDLKVTLDFDNQKMVGIQKLYMQPK